PQPPDHQARGGNPEHHAERAPLAAPIRPAHVALQRDADPGAADAHLVAVAQPRFADAPVVEPGAVLAAEIAHHEPAVLGDEFAVLVADALVGEREIVVALPADLDPRMAERMARTGAVGIPHFEDRRPGGLVHTPQQQPAFRAEIKLENRWRS